MSGVIRSDLPSPITADNAADAAAQPAQAEGSYRGERVVQLPSMASMIADSAEEVTFSVSEHQEKDLSKRKIEEGKKSDLIERILAIQKIEQLAYRLKDLNLNHLTRALTLLLRMKNASPRQLRERARENFPEPAHQYVALAALLEGLRQQGAGKAQIEAAEAALQQLLTEHGPTIQAALNITATAADFAGAGLGDIPQLRATYRDAVMDYQGVAEAFHALTEKYPAAELPRAITFLLKALSADMSATDASSMDKTRLSAILDDMYRLEVLSGLLEECDALIGQTRRRGAETPLRGPDLLQEVLKLQQDKWIRPEQIAPLPARLGISELPQEISFLREFKELARIIPLKAYADPEQRPRFVDAVQLALDDAIDREEEEDDAW